MAKRKKVKPSKAESSVPPPAQEEPSPVGASAEVVNETYYRTYIDERKILVESEQTISDEFDKAILTLSSGSLGLSLIFIEKIAPNPLLETIPSIQAAWLCFGVSVGTTLLGFRASVLAYRKQRDILEADFFPDTKPLSGSKKNLWSSATTGLNWAAIITFFAGACFLGHFSLKNMENRAQSDLQVIKGK